MFYSELSDVLRSGNALVRMPIILFIWYIPFIYTVICIYDIFYTVYSILLRMIDNKPKESSNKSPKPRNSTRPETNATAKSAPECLRENNAQSCTKVPEHVPVSFVEHVRTEETNCFGKESSTTCTSLRIWLG